MELFGRSFTLSWPAMCRRVFSQCWGVVGSGFLSFVIVLGLQDPLGVRNGLKWASADFIEKAAKEGKF